MVSERVEVPQGTPNARKTLGPSPAHRYTDFMKHFTLWLVASFLSFSALAQWQWLDHSGRRVFSDMPPGVDVPDAQILKRPGQPVRSSETQGHTAQGAWAETKSGAPQVNDKDRDLLSRKKQADDAQAAKRKAEELNAARQRADNCARARQAQANLALGTRMARINDKGEREFFDEGMRADEARRLQAIIDSDCY